MKCIAIALLLLFAVVSVADAQSSSEASSWGIVGSIVPKWATTSSVKKLATLVFPENDGELDLQGAEFRIGIARGRMLAGDWGVSFVRKTFADDATQTIIVGAGCGGGSVSGRLVLTCDRDFTEMTPNKLQLSGVEVHKFISFVTISERVQIGLNVAGGVAVGQGTFDTKSFHAEFSCTFPPGAGPTNFESECEGASISPEVVTQTGTGSEEFTRMMRYSKNLVPLGKLEVAGAVLLGSRAKVRVSGGLNYPGLNSIAVTGIYFFGSN